MVVSPDVVIHPIRNALWRSWKASHDKKNGQRPARQQGNKAASEVFARNPAG
jgi:hypothetical protein